MNHSRNMKICAHCGKIIIITGSCQDYLYKRGSLYYCGYNHWHIAEAEAPPKKKIHTISRK